MRVIEIPRLLPLRTDESYVVAAGGPKAAPPIPSYATYFVVPGVAESDVVRVLSALLERRFVERARKVAHNASSLSEPTLWPTLQWTLVGLLVGAAIGALWSSIALGAAGGALLGMIAGLWRRQQQAIAYRGLSLVCAPLSERLHSNYWLATAIRRLCSPRVGFRFDV